MAVNLFPINAQVDGQRFDQVRFYGTDGRGELWGLVAGKPAVVASADGFLRQARTAGETFADGTKAKWLLLFADGSAWLATPGVGCGCSHPLKRFDPASAVRT